jgi:hypothetical protein
MDPATFPPTDKLRQRITLALESYVSRVSKINYGKLRSAIHDTNVNWDTDASSRSEEEQAHSIEQRIWAFQDQYLVSSYDSELEDLVTNIDDLLDPDTARRILPAIIDPPTTPEESAQWMRKIESELQSQVAMRSNTGSDSDSNVALPNEYRVLMSLCDAIFPAGLHSEVESGGVVAIRALCSVKTPPLDEVRERLCLERVGYTIHAGFITEPYCEGERACAGWALCERAATEKVRERKKAWRIVFTLRMDSCPYTYDSVEEFLRWYAGYGIRDYNSWDYEDGLYVNKDGNPVEDQ